MIDSHCHPQFAAYAEDRDEVIRRAIAAGVTMIAVGTSYETSETAVELSRGYPEHIRAAVGIHPGHSAAAPHDPMEAAKEISGETLDNRFYELARLPEVVAIGETGLDYKYLKPAPGDNTIAALQSVQRENFLAHIELAKAVKKPLVIHARDAYRDVFGILCESLFPHGIAMHFFQGTIADAAQFLELGAYISFAGPITFAAEYDAVIKYVPLERILTETDAPYAAPAPHRGKRNEPAFVELVVRRIANVKNLEYEKVAEITAKNARTFFNIGTE